MNRVLSMSKLNTFCVSGMIEAKYSFFRSLKKGKIIMILSFIILYMVGCNKIVHWILGKYEEQSEETLDKWPQNSYLEILSQADLYQNNEDFNSEAIVKFPPYKKMTKKDHRLDDDYGDLEISFQDPHETPESVFAPLNAISDQDDNIFFVEFNDQKAEFHCLELCSIESASLQNPQAQIYIILNGMERKIFGAPNPMESLTNIQVINMNLKELLYHEMALTFKTNIKEGKVIQSPEMRELVRSLLLYHKGGVSLEADTISVQPLPFNISNFLSLGNNGQLNSGVLRFQPRHEFLIKVLEHRTSILTVPHKKREKENIFQNILNDFCPTIDSKLKYGKSPPTQLQSKSCPSSWSTRLFTLDEMFATDSWHISRGKLLWQVKSRDRYPLATLMHLQDLPKAVCDYAEETELPNGLTSMMKFACPNHFELLSSKVSNLY